MVQLNRIGEGFSARTKTVAEIIAAVRLSHEGVNFAGEDGAREIIQDLWGCGWTFVRRASGDPFDVDPKLIPAGKHYEWRVKGSAPVADWKAVPAARHDGVFAPCGYDGWIEVGGQVLMECPKARADKVNQERVDKAHKNVDNWIERFGGQGISGGVRVWTGDENAPPPSSWSKVGDPVMAEKIIEKSPQLLPPPKVALPVIKQRIPRHPWLRWLFNLISTEQ